MRSLRWGCLAAFTPRRRCGGKSPPTLAKNPGFFLAAGAARLAELRLRCVVGAAGGGAGSALVVDQGFGQLRPRNSVRAGRGLGQRSQPLALRQRKLVPPLGAAAGSRRAPFRCPLPRASCRAGTSRAGPAARGNRRRQKRSKPKRKAHSLPALSTHVSPFLPRRTFTSAAPGAPTRMRKSGVSRMSALWLVAKLISSAP